MPSDEKNQLDKSENPLDQLQIGFWGPINEKGKRRYVKLAIDNHSKWAWTKITRKQTSKAVIKF